ncbi:uncharacterized protein M421DRAFT_424715 [Didymella exigua CBS 183.55]|uniref:Uncharacterized protein n=1 Tax=Didymella exigua CBS 183.55 TaxID=1150837 RepID=A0A6A5RB63_9PLEO|nr:uncharacterized protein M421DRAFT_424715 [Didymella exigua CBS 183.55]KAF1924579.1 hypothetical protein M421DRAFT_424715 [Didymella exigua CBS 183.55]
MANDNKNAESKTYRQQAGDYYNRQYDNWVPWMEDKYLQWFTKDNKASYATKQNLDKTKVTGVSQVDNLQDGVHGMVSGQVGQGGLLQPVGDALSKEGINRAERGGKDDKGKPLESQGPLGGYGQGAVDGVKGGAGAVGSGVGNAGKSAGGYLGGLWGGKKEGEEKK